MSKNYRSKSEKNAHLSHFSGVFIFTQLLIHPVVVTMVTLFVSLTFLVDTFMKTSYYKREHKH